MKRFARSSTIMLCLLAAATAAYAQTPPAPEEDTQLWTDVQVILPVHDKVDLQFIGTFRLGRDVSHPVDERAAVAVVFKPKKFLTLTPSYLYQAAQPSEGRKSYEHRLILTGAVKFPLRGFSIEDRNQFERRFRNSQLDSTRYRNRLRVELPASLGKFSFNVFAADEVFYDWSVDDWVRNRFSAGGFKKFAKRYTAEVYYLRQNDGRARPGDLHVIGTILKIQLDRLGRRSDAPEAPAPPED